nr:EAL domain-containing protein [Methylobacterium sp. L1A1]
MATLALLITSAAAIFVVDLERRAVADLERNLSGLSMILADQAERSFQAIELVQESMLREIDSAELHSSDQFEKFVSTRSIHESLAKRISALPQINAITIVDHVGKLLNFSRRWPIPDVNIRDRDYFKAMESDGTIQRFVSEPVLNRGDGTLTIYIARRVNAVDGTFIGLLLGAVQLGYYEHLYREIAPASDYVISLFRQDGTLLVRHPHREGTIGQRFLSAGASLIAARKAKGGVIRTVSPIDGRDRLVATRSLKSYPLILSVSRTAEAGLASWRQEATVIGLGVISVDLGLIGLFVLGYLAHGRQRRLAEMKAELAAAELRELNENDLRVQHARFGTALAHLVQGLCLFDDEHLLVIMNEQFVRMHDIPDYLQRPGTSVKVLREYMRGRVVDASLPHCLSPPVGALLHAADVPSFTCDLLDGKAVAVVRAPIPGGGWICTHEDITERRRSEERIARIARTDTLTGLANRMQFQERLDTALGTSPECGIAILYLDLDGFKVVNDRHGHPVGDACLKLVARCLLSAIGKGDMVARLGGDEFAILTTDNGADELAARICQLLSQPLIVSGFEHSIGTSIGIATRTADDMSAECLLRRADVALYQAKAAGRGTWRFFDPAMDAETTKRNILSDALRTAVIDQQLRLYYQPIVDVRSGDLRGFEALMRWQHNELGNVNPGEFIPIAEETGLIRPMGDWALREACFEAMRWPKDLRVAVNLSPVQFKGMDLVRAVCLALDASGLAAERLELEITESLLLRDDEETLVILHQLHKLGIRISLDDFGTGYSSLSYLQRFPIQKIKLDQSFVRNLAEDTGSLEIVRAVVSLGKALSITVLAEGVETVDQLHLLQREGCEECQGYLIDRPLPASEALKLARGNAAPDEDQMANILFQKVA